MIEAQWATRADSVLVASIVHGDDGRVAPLERASAKAGDPARMVA